MRRVGNDVPLDGDVRTAALRNANACQQMVELCDELLEVAPDLSPREFLRSLGAFVAGIDVGIMGVRQLARGGTNGLLGAGFRPEYDDGTAGQARHFAGTAAAAALIGDKPAELLAHHVVDPADSIDGHLSTAALEFARLLVDGSLALDQAGSWIAGHVCDPEFRTDDGFTPFDALVERPEDARALRNLFSVDEWRALTELPERVAVAAALVEATGGFEAVRDIIAGTREIGAGGKGQSELVHAIVAERFEEGFEWGDDARSPEDRVEHTLQAVHANLLTLREKEISSDEIVAYATFLLNVAGKAVRGSRSGGILGIGKHEVSGRERAFLEQLEETLEAGLPACDGCLT